MYSAVISLFSRWLNWIASSIHESLKVGERQVVQSAVHLQPLPQQSNGKMEVLLELYYLRYYHTTKCWTSVFKTSGMFDNIEKDAFE